MVLRYFGGKGRIKNLLLGAILQQLGKLEQDSGVSIVAYAEPFTGMLSVGLVLLPRLPPSVRRVYISDADRNVVTFWKAVAHSNWVPKASPVSARKWTTMRVRCRQRQQPCTPQEFVYGPHLSYMGKFFAHVQPDPMMNVGPSLQRVGVRIHAARSILRTYTVHVCNTAFMKMEYSNTLIYCDPPYRGLRENQWRQSAGVGEWDERGFWAKVGSWLQPSRKNLVFVSSASIPATTGSVCVRVIWKMQNGINGHRPRMEYLLFCTLP